MAARLGLPPPVGRTCLIVLAASQDAVSREQRGLNMRSMTWWAHEPRPYWVDLFHAHFKVDRELQARVWVWVRPPPGDFDAAAHAGAAEEVDAIAAEALREAAAQLGRARAKAVGVGGNGAREAGEAGGAAAAGGSSKEEL